MRASPQQLGQLGKNRDFTDDPIAGIARLLYKAQAALRTGDDTAFITITACYVLLSIQMASERLSDTYAKNEEVRSDRRELERVMENLQREERGKYEETLVQKMVIGQKE